MNGSMKLPYEKVKSQLLDHPKTWLVTGVAGFIGSNILEQLLKLDQVVVGLDNLSTGSIKNLDDVKHLVTDRQWERFTFIKGDIMDYTLCVQASKGVDYVLHQAALGSVPRSLSDPITTNSSNITGFLNILNACKENDVQRFCYAASSSTYGDHPVLPKVEDQIGNPLSPYAVTKLVNEIYAKVYDICYKYPTIGLRYFNVFGPRQNPNGAYAAVIPRWIESIKNDGDVVINGDGLTSRDFCYIENTIEANILAATTPKIEEAKIYNVALGDRTSLNELAGYLYQAARDNGIVRERKLIYKPFRDGDVRHSEADITKISSELGYSGRVQVQDGIKKTVSWFLAQ